MGIKIKLIKSPSSASAKQVGTVKGLGVWKFGSERLLKDEPKTRVRAKPRKIRVRDAARAKRAAQDK